MPHIRLVEDDDNYAGCLYINGTKVFNDDCITASQLIVILHENLGIDAKSYRFTPKELDDQVGDHWPDKLREFGDLVDREDRI
jgi:hypothetical protein